MSNSVMPDTTRRMQFPPSERVQEDGEKWEPGKAQKTLPSYKESNADYTFIDLDNLHLPKHKEEL